MKIIKSPQPLLKIDSAKKLFLAGSIELGAAEDWQQKVEGLLNNTDWVIFNPRRDNWDNSWVQSINNPQFREQVEWELKAQEEADKIIMYFDPSTKSPISLLELGLFGRERGKMIVVCPDGFWRKGNVDIVCERYKIKQVGTLEEAINLLLSDN